MGQQMKVLVDMLLTIFILAFSDKTLTKRNRLLEMLGIIGK